MGRFMYWFEESKRVWLWGRRKRKIENGERWTEEREKKLYHTDSAS
jgi:hypothetical protein